MPLSHWHRINYCFDLFLPASVVSLFFRHTILILHLNSLLPLIFCFPRVKAFPSTSYDANHLPWRSVIITIIFLLQNQSYIFDLLTDSLNRLLNSAICFLRISLLNSLNLSWLALVISCYYLTFLSKRAYLAFSAFKILSWNLSNI